ncbi:MAG TPA: alpha/beta hydrolase [Actinomycetota bacterium]|nr:alpha/beta hydrolase [Actinomycetota bacterium]
MRFVVSNGVRLAVDVIGDGEPVTVVGHGLTGSRKDLSVLAPFVPGTKVLFDFRGHGDSDRPPPGSYSMDDFAADVDHVAAAFGATAVVGVSLAGGATLRLLRSKPDRFERLVFILPARLERSAAAHRALRRLADLLETKPLDEVADLVVAEEEEEGMFAEFPAARDRRREAILAMNGDGMPYAIRESLDDPPIPDLGALRRVTAPALIVAQEGDPVHRAEVARELAGALPHAELLMFRDRHALLREVVAVTRKVGGFLGQAT